MQSLCVKLDSGMAKKLKEAVKEFNYGTITELVRDSLRGKLKELEQERQRKKAWEKLLSLRGSLKGKGKFRTDKEFYKWRMENSENRAKEIANGLGIKI